MLIFEIFGYILKTKGYILFFWKFGFF